MNKKRKFLIFHGTMMGKLVIMFSMFYLSGHPLQLHIYEVLRQQVFESKRYESHYFLDNGIGANSSLDNAKSVSIYVKQHFEKLVILFADDKFEWFPTQNKVYSKVCCGIWKKGNFLLQRTELSGLKLVLTLFI